MPRQNPLWAAPRIRSELLLLGATRSGGAPDPSLHGIVHRDLSGEKSGLVLPLLLGGSAGEGGQDLFLAQRFARHVSPLTTTVYTHPSDEELFNLVRSPTR